MAPHPDQALGELLLAELDHIAKELRGAPSSRSESFDIDMEIADSPTPFDPIGRHGPANITANTSLVWKPRDSGPSRVSLIRPAGRISGVAARALKERHPKS